MDDLWAGEIGKRILNARDKAGLSQAELGEAIGRSGAMIGHYENGKRAPFKDLRQIAEATDSDLRWLLHGKSYTDPLLYLGARVERIEKMLSTVPGAGAPPELPAELGRYAGAALPTERKAPRKRRRSAQGAD
jgi:transcriptional regulator with XRE-family HTH domain